MLGQALHDHSLPRDSPSARSESAACPVPRAEIAPPPFLPTSRVVDFSRVLAAYPCGIFTKPRRLSGHFPPTPRVVEFSCGLAAYPCAQFSPRPGAYPDIFCPLLGSLALPATRVGFSPSLGANLGVFCSLPEQLIIPPGWQLTCVTFSPSVGAIRTFFARP